MANELTINFTAASPAPSGGYLVRYWETSTPGTVLTKTVTESPAVISGLTGYNYTGTIESVCSFGNSTRVNFTDAVCNVSFNISSTAPTNQQGTNGTATISNIIGGSGTYTYSWNTTPVQTTITATGLVAGQTYVATVTDTITSCVTTRNIVVGQTNFTFDADFMVITYEFTNGTDLDTRTRIVSIDGTTYTDQNGQGKHIGYAQYLRTPQTATYPGVFPSRICDVPIKPLAIWGSDNELQGFESVMIDFTQLGVGQNEIVIDCRALWWVAVGTNPVKLSFTLYKGGCMIKQGPSGSPAFNFTNTGFTGTLAGASASKVITAFRNTSLIATGSSDLESPNISAGLSRGQRLAVIRYNRATNVGSIDINDTTTPVV